MGDLSAERLRDLVSYCPRTGAMIWRRRVNSRVPTGSVAGCCDRLGYRRLKIDGRAYLAHRLAWLYVHGEWPVDEIDHINGQPSDNRLANLRAANSAQNKHNATLRRTNTSGTKGVRWHRQRCKWCARITYAGQERHLGLFDRKIDAAAAYDAAAKKFFGEFARPNEVLGE